LQGVRIFTLGIDQSVNEGFLGCLAALTPGGACKLVESQGRLKHAMDRMHRLISTPALTDVQIDGPGGLGIEPLLDAVTPAKHGAVFTGSPTFISGRYRKTSSQGLESARAHFVTVSAKTAAGENWNQAVPALQTLNPALSALWARALIRELDDRFTIASTPSYNYYPGYGRQVEETPNSDKPDELRARILALSLRFKVLSRFSTFVAVDKEEKVESDASQLTRVTQPVESPAGWGRTLGAAKGCGLPPGSKAGGSALRDGRGRSYESGVVLTSAPFGGGGE
jgi:Ca-activated chloride channel family protein